MSSRNHLTSYLTQEKRKRKMAKFQIVNCANSAGLVDAETQEDETLGQFLSTQYSEDDMDIGEAIVRVNKRRVEPNDYVLHDGDMVTLSPANVSGE